MEKFINKNIEENLKIFLLRKNCKFCLKPYIENGGYFKPDKTYYFNKFYFKLNGSISKNRMPIRYNTTFFISENYCTNSNFLGKEYRGTYKLSKSQLADDNNILYIVFCGNCGQNEYFEYNFGKFNSSKYYIKK